MDENTLFFQCMYSNWSSIHLTYMKAQSSFSIVFKLLQYYTVVFLIENFTYICFFLSIIHHNLLSLKGNNELPPLNIQYINGKTR